MGGHRKAAALTLITMSDQVVSSATPEVLDRLAAAAMARIVELISDIPDGTEEELGALATVIMGEILARTLAIPDMPAFMIQRFADRLVSLEYATRSDSDGRYCATIAGREIDAVMRGPRP